MLHQSIDRYMADSCTSPVTSSLTVLDHTLADCSTLDFHPDPFYKTHSSTTEDDVCHRGSGPAGFYGAETTNCDSPISLTNSTFAWVNHHLRDKIDFVIWTGDSARHDNDDQVPRSEQQVVDLNKLLVGKFGEVFGKDGDPKKDFIVPIVPTFGNNDILPHNIFTAGPNRWTKRYAHIWRKFVPEEQIHSFERGGWFFVEVIPNTLAVFSLNTLYFFDSNTAVDGCADKSEPGFEQFEWLRIQLQFLRLRGMKAIITGHVAPARTDSKTSWDETCWHKYAYWMQQYRDVVVGSTYGHMNIDHFMLQDFQDIDDGLMDGKSIDSTRIAIDEGFTIQGSASYLNELQSDWSRLPSQPETMVDNMKKRGRRGKKGKKSKAEKYLEKIGGEYAERFSVSLVSPSVVPNYFPTLRVIEYNVTGLENAPVTGSMDPTCLDSSENLLGEILPCSYFSHLVKYLKHTKDSLLPSTKHHKKHPRKRHPKKPHKPSFTHPLPPSKSAPPGPAYSPQSLSWLSYTQYFANLTWINGDFTSGPATDEDRRSSDTDLNNHDGDDPIYEKRWKEGKYRGRKPKPDQDRKYRHHSKFEYEIEYSTRNDSIFNLTDLTVRSWLELAGRIGEYREKWDLKLEPDCCDYEEDDDDDVNNNIDVDVDADATDESIESELITTLEKPIGDSNNNNKKYHYKSDDGKKNHKDKKKEKKREEKRRRRIIQELWYTFVKRAYVDSKSKEEIRDNF